MLLDDLLRKNLSVVFCGTALSDTSHRLRAYYAHPGNRFYAALASCGFTPHQLAPSEYPRLLQWGIGLTDLNKTEHGADSALSADAFDADALRVKIVRYAPEYLAFTSKRAAQEYFKVARVEYGLQRERIGSTRTFVLPSPSGRATRYWDETPWCELAGLYQTACDRRRS